MSKACLGFCCCCQGGGGGDGPPAYLTALFDIADKIGEGTYGVVYLARSRGRQPRTLAVKTFKPGKEGEGVSPTAIREILLLRELRHEHIVHLESVHLNRQARMHACRPLACAPACIK